MGRIMRITVNVKITSIPNMAFSFINSISSLWKYENKVNSVSVPSFIGIFAYL